MANTMNFDKFTIKSQKAVEKAIEIATAKQNQAIETSHLVKGMLLVDENVIPYLLKKLQVNLDSFTPALDRIIDAYPRVSGGEQHLSSEATKALEKANTLSQESGDEFVSLEQLLVGIFSVNNSTSRLLKENGVTEKDLKTAISQMRKGSTANSQTAEETYNALNKYARNLNDLARSGKLDPVIGRDEEIRRVLQILSRRTKNNPILIGRDHPLHRRNPYPCRGRRQRRRHGRRKYSQARALAGRTACHRGNDLKGIPEIFREGQGARAAFPAGNGQ
jgi:ATP-dependent Clp protease ATP-binding subunit ClpB